MTKSKVSLNKDSCSELSGMLIQTIDLEQLVEEVAYHIHNGNITAEDINAAVERRKSPRKRK